LRYLTPATAVCWSELRRVAPLVQSLAGNCIDAEQFFPESDFAEAERLVS
jgi:hypothetical protein